MDSKKQQTGSIKGFRTPKLERRTLQLPEAYIRLSLPSEYGATHIRTQKIDLLRRRWIIEFLNKEDETVAAWEERNLRCTVEQNLDSYRAWEATIVSQRSLFMTKSPRGLKRLMRRPLLSVPTFPKADITSTHLEKIRISSYLTLLMIARTIRTILRGSSTLSSTILGEVSELDAFIPNFKLGLQ